MTETVAEILDAYRRGALRPEDVVARSFARIRRHDDPAIFIALRGEADVVAEAKRWHATATGAAALRHPGRGQGQYRREGLADHGGMSRVRLSAGQGRYGCCKTRRRARSSSARPISISLPLASSAWHALRHRPQPVRQQARRRRFEHRLGAGGRCRLHAARARHQYRGIGPGTGGLQRQRRVKTKPPHRACAGVVPACRTLDCVSVFALTVDDAMAMLDVIAGPDAADHIRIRGRSARPDHAEGQNSACRCRANVSSATRFGQGLQRSAGAATGLGAKSSRSTSSRSMRQRGYSTTGRGSLNVISSPRR